MTKQELIEKMRDVAEGNPGCLSVLLEIVSVPEFIDYLHEFGPRGPAVWTLYKDWCKEDIMIFAEILGVLMKHRQPEVMTALKAEFETHLFAEAWKNANVGN